VFSKLYKHPETVRFVHLSAGSFRDKDKISDDDWRSDCDLFTTGRQTDRRTQTGSTYAGRRLAKFSLSRHCWSDIRRLRAAPVNEILMERR